MKSLLIYWYHLEFLQQHITSLVALFHINSNYFSQQNFLYFFLKRFPTKRFLIFSYQDKPNDSLAISESFKSEVKITGNTPTDGNIKDVEIIVPLKYLSIFWRTLEMPSINCEVNLTLTQSSTCVITNFTGARRFAITDTQLYVPVVTLSTQDNSKLLQQLKSGFNRTINWNKYQSDTETYA